MFRLLVATADKLSGAAAAELNLQTNKQKSKSRQTKKMTFKMCRSILGKWLLSECTGLKVVTFKMYRSRCGSGYFQVYRSIWGKGLLSKCTSLDGVRSYFQNVSVYVGEGVNFKMYWSRR